MARIEVRVEFVCVYVSCIEVKGSVDNFFV